LGVDVPSTSRPELRTLVVRDCELGTDAGVVQRERAVRASVAHAVMQRGL
jgi:hypothetical protein